MIDRPRRNRVSPGIRDLVAETRLTPANLVWPAFVTVPSHATSQK